MQTRRLGPEELVEYGVRTLAARACSIGELRQKLGRRAERAADVDAALARLGDLGYLDDKRFAESYAAARRETGGFGKTRVVRDLRRRRVAPTVAQRAVEKAYQGSDEIALIESLLRRKYRGKAPDGFLTGPKELAAAYRRLVYAGFSSGTVIHVLKRFAREPELLDQFEPPDSGQQEE